MMKKSIFLAMVATTSALMAGGKIAPVITPVAPIVETPIDATPFYLGLGAMMTYIDRDPCPCTPDGPNLEDHRGGIIVRAGADYNQYIGLEARYLKTLGSNTFSETEHYGLYLKPQYHITQQANVYGLLGYGKTTVDYTNGVLHSSTSESGVSYGIGVEYDLTKDERAYYDRPFDGQGDQEQGWGLWLDFQHLLNNAGQVHTDNNVVTGGITYDF